MSLFGKSHLPLSGWRHLLTVMLFYQTCDLCFHWQIKKVKKLNVSRFVCSKYVQYYNRREFERWLKCRSRKTMHFIQITCTWWAPIYYFPWIVQIFLRFPRSIEHFVEGIALFRYSVCQTSAIYWWRSRSVLNEVNDLVQIYYSLT